MGNFNSVNKWYIKAIVIDCGVSIRLSPGQILWYHNTYVVFYYTIDYSLSFHHCLEFLQTVCSLGRLHFNWQNIPFIVLPNTHVLLSQSNSLRSCILAQGTRSMLPMHWLLPFDSTGLFKASFISLMHPQPYSFFFCINGSFPHFTYSSLISVRSSPVLYHLEHLGVTFMEFISLLNWPCDRVLVSALT